MPRRRCACARRAHARSTYRYAGDPLVRRLLRPLLGLGFELGFERRKLGKGRIRIRHLLPPLLRSLLEGAALAIPPRWTIGSPMTRMTFALALFRTMPARLVRPLRRRLGAFCSDALRLIGCDRRRCRLRGLLAAMAAWFGRTRAIGRPAGAPDFDQCGLLSGSRGAFGPRIRGDRRPRLGGLRRCRCCQRRRFI